MDVPSPPQRVLIVRMSHLGDIAQTLALAHAVRAALPEAELGWAIQPEFAPLVAPFARVFPFERRGGAAAWPRLRRALRAWGPNLVLDAQGNWKSAACLAVSGAHRRIGFARSEWQEPLASRLVAVEQAAPAGDEAGDSHLVARCRRLAARALPACPAREGPEAVDPLLSLDERAAGRAALAAVTEAAAPIVLHPGVAGDPRSWPLERFQGLAARLAEERGLGRRVLVLTGPGEAEVGAALRRAVPAAAHLVGQRGLRELAALLGAVAERGGRVVACDSGPAHVAASVGLPVHLLAGPEDPARTGPWPVIGTPGSRHRLVAPPRGWAPTGPWAPRAIESIGVDAALGSALAQDS